MGKAERLYLFTVVGSAVSAQYDSSIFMWQARIGLGVFWRQRVAGSQASSASSSHLECRCETGRTRPWLFVVVELLVPRFTGWRSTQLSVFCECIAVF